MKRILVAGGAGQLGHRLCQHLAELKYEVYALDNLSRSSDSTVKWGPLIKRDTRETGPITQALKKEKIEAIIHCAFLCDLGESESQPAAYYDNNFSGTLSLIKAAQAAGIKTFIFSAPNSDTPDSPYKSSLSMSEQLLKDVAFIHPNMTITTINSNTPADYSQALKA